MASSEQLEREAEATRARIAETLTELRTRIGPGQLAEQAIDYARASGGGDFMRRLGRQVANNPLPVALMSAGIAWLMAAERRSGNAVGRSNAASRKGDGSVETTEPDSSSERNRTVAMTTEFEKTSRRTTGGAQAAADETKRAGSQAFARASDIAASAYETGTDTAARAYDKASELTGSAYEHASEAAARAGRAATGAYDRARDAAERTATSVERSTRGFARFAREEPLVLAGLGIAFGALVGALLPATEVENRAMGEASDDLKRDARDVARDQWERGKAMAEEGWDEAKQAARRTWEDAKAEAQKSWDATEQEAAAAGGRTGAHGADLTGAQAPLVPSKEETKAAAKAQSRSSQSSS